MRSGLSLPLLASAVLALALGVVAYFLEGYWQASLLGIATIFLTVAISEIFNLYREELGRPIFVITLLTIVSAGVLMLTVYLGFIVISDRRIAPFPGNGIIANFRGPAGATARTAMGTSCALISDSDRNMDSLVSYKRVADNASSAGHLRIWYDLKGTEAVPMVGIICAFGPPPGRVFNASSFDNLRFRLRSTDAAGRISVRVVLYSKSMSDVSRALYHFPTYEIDADDVPSHWKWFKLPFFEFREPVFANGDIALDPGQVFQIAFDILGSPKRETKGTLEIGDIAFAHH